MAGGPYPLTQSVIVDDSEYESFQNALEAYGTVIESFLTQYSEIVNGICDDAITEGAVAQNLKVFSLCVRNAIGTVGDATTTTKQACAEFLQSIDNADSYLY